MNIQDALMTRSPSKCELCENAKNLNVYSVEPQQSGDANDAILVCQTCLSQQDNNATLDTNHWRCLNTSMWSEVSAVKIISWRMLNRLKSESWALDLLEQIYLTDDELLWAKSGLIIEDEQTDAIIHKDSNGAVLQNGDTVTLIKDLVVKGAGFTAKRGTAVRNISLVEDNPEQITGKVNGTQIVLLTQFLKKSN